jgi:hypothetical protein
MEPATDDLWIAALAHHLARRWRTVDPDVLEDVAADIARDPKLRALAPDEAAVLWLEPVGTGRRSEEFLEPEPGELEQSCTTCFTRAPRRPAATRAGSAELLGHPSLA